MYEIEMVNKVCDYLRDKGIAAVTEVPFMQQSNLVIVTDIMNLRNFSKLLAVTF